MLSDEEVVEEKNFQSNLGFNCKVLYSEGALASQEERDDDFGHGTFEDLTCMVADIIGSFVDEVEIVSCYSQSCICFRFIVEDTEQAGYLLGSKLKHLNALWTYLRSQQVYPQNRFLKVELEKRQSSGDHDDVQEFWNRKTGSSKDAA